MEVMIYRILLCLIIYAVHVTEGVMQPVKRHDTKGIKPVRGTH